MENFEEILRKDLHQFLLSMKEVDERLPECPDVEDKWEEIAKTYIPDGIREFQDYPSASLGWMMYIGMAVAKMWDTEWDIYSKIDDLYAYMRDKRGSTTRWMNIFAKMSSCCRAQTTQLWRKSLASVLHGSIMP